MIRKLIERGAEVRQLGSLHAKVYIGSETVVVTSANASANGLALEGPEQAHWIEAGVEFMRADARDVLAWFEATWGVAREISERDLEQATKLWKPRRRQRPTVSFSDYDIEAAIHEGTLPVTCWWAEGHDWDVDEAAVQQAGISFALDMRAVEVEHEDDLSALPPGTWLLWWERGKSGAPRKGKLTISQIGRYEPGVLRHVKGNRPNVGCVLNAETPDPEPFDPTGPRFGQAFREVIVRPKFDLLRSDGGPPWFTILQPHLPEFWRQVQQRHRELPGA